MTRDELLRTLARLVQKGRMTTEEARVALQAYDAGLEPDQLPLATAALVSLIQPADEREAVRFLSRLVRPGAQTNDVREAARQIRTVPINRRTRFIIRIADVYDEEVIRTVDAFSKGQIGVRGLHERMQRHIKQDLIQSATLGKGNLLTAPELERLNALARRQQVYLARFMREVAAKAASGRPMSPADIRQRARQYSEHGLTEGYRYREQAIVEDRGAYGWVVDYEARDDGRTCGPCQAAEAEGPYLPGTGPYPGTECRGGGKCRCRRTERYDPEAYEALREGVAA